MDGKPVHPPYKTAGQRVVVVVDTPYVGSSFLTTYYPHFSFFKLTS